MENVTLVDILVCFIHLIWYFVVLFSELSLLTLSGSISRFGGLGLPTRLFISILIIGTILMILFPFQPQYNAHKYYKSVNAHLYEVFKYHLYLQNRPPNIGDNYSWEIGHKKCMENVVTLQIIFEDSINVDNEEISTITECLSSNEILNESASIEYVKLEEIKLTNFRIAKIPKDDKTENLNLCTDEKINQIETSIVLENYKNVKIVKDIEDKDSESVDRIKNVKLSDVSSIWNNEIVSESSSGSESSNEINSIKCDTIGRTEKVLSLIELNLSVENCNEHLENVNSCETFELDEDSLSVIDTDDIMDDML